MNRLQILLISMVAVAANAVAAPFTLTASKVTIEDMTIDKNNFFVKVDAATSSGEYEVAFDIWPAKHSAIGTFSSTDKSIGYVSSYVHKTKANDNAVNMWYYPVEESAISLTITDNGNGKCTLTGSIQAVRQGTQYTYNITEFEFAYTETPDDNPEPEKDPYRFEPAAPTTINFVGDVVSFKKKEGFVNITLNEMANETYDWIEINLISDELAMPAGTYPINNSGAVNTLTASRGYLGTQNDDPCYVAIRADKDNWGQYTPYYLVSGSLVVSYNAKTDTIYVTGQAKSHNGTTVNVNVRSYNMLYNPDDAPKEPENVTLAIDSVVITYNREKADKDNKKHPYTFNFFNKSAEGFPNVLVDVMLSDSMQLKAGTYTMAANQLTGVALFQNQTDFNNYFFGGAPYVFTSVSLTLADAGNGKWTYSMLLNDEIGSEYRFTLTQAPHIINYPPEEEQIDPKDKPYSDEQKEKVSITAVFDSIVWKDETVTKDGVLDIYLFQQMPDVNGLRAAMQLGFYTSSTAIPVGSYPVNSSEEENTFSASLGRYGNVLIPCYLSLIDDNNWVHAIWYIVDGTIRIDRLAGPLFNNDEDIRSYCIYGDCVTYFGSTVHFTFIYSPQAVEDYHSDTPPSVRKVLHDGMIYIIRDGRTFTIEGREIK